MNHSICSSFLLVATSLTALPCKAEFGAHYQISASIFDKKEESWLKTGSEFYQNHKSKIWLGGAILGIATLGFLYQDTIIDAFNNARDAFRDDKIKKDPFRDINDNHKAPLSDSSDSSNNDNQVPQAPLETDSSPKTDDLPKDDRVKNALKKLKSISGGGSCSHPYSSEIWSQEGLNDEPFRDSLKTRNWDYKSSFANSDIKIPHIFHNTWVSSSKIPEEKRSEYFFKHNPYLKNNVEKMSNWEKFFWTTDKNMIPQKAQKHLSDLGITLRQIDELKGTHPEFSYLVDVAKGAAEEKLFGLSTDIIRYLAIHEMGGVYADGDYRFDTDPTALTKKYDSYFGVETSCNLHLGNAFLAAKPQHDVINEAINIAVRNLDGHGPRYVYNPCVKHDATIMYTGPVALSMAYAKANKQMQGKDFAFWHGAIFTKDDCSSGYGFSIPELGYSKQGNHDFASNWTHDAANVRAN